MVRTFCRSEKRSCPDFDSVKIPIELIRIERTIDWMSRWPWVCAQLPVDHPRPGRASPILLPGVQRNKLPNLGVKGCRFDAQGRTIGSFTHTHGVLLHCQIGAGFMTIC